MNPAWYARQSPVTDPRDRAFLLDAVSGPVAALVAAIHGLFVHPLWADRHGLILTDSHREDLQLRFVHRMAGRLHDLDPRPLAAARPPERRLLGNCRDQSVFLCAWLRRRGVPARARCGFSTYFRPGRFEDHWICEYWDGLRWVAVDPQLDALQRDALGLAFDPLDLPPGQFIDGATAWLMCREGRADPDHFGILDLQGLWFVRGNLVRDLAALNRAEVLPWDGWGLAAKAEPEVSARDLRLLDGVARTVAAGDRALYELYGQEELRVPVYLLEEA
ncbi:MAG: transglutaminase domain-containing protein [bacterium]|nr:transglutaminase domain-containing protein [bacterium]